MSTDPKDTRAQAGAFTRRAALLGLGQAAAFAVLGSRLYQLQVLESSRYAPLADDNRINTLALAPMRGRIFDRSGRMLADSVESFRVMIVPSLVDDLPAALQRLGRIIPINDETRARVLSRAKRQAVNLPIVIAADLPWDQVARINLHAPELPGVETGLFSRRRYYSSRTMGHIVGHVGAVERFALGDDPVLRIPGMRIGRVGVERGMDRSLRGVAGAVQREVDVRGRIVRDLARTEPRNGKDQVLTIDTQLQHRVLSRLAEERRAAAVVMHVASGEVMALASWPTYDAADVEARTGKVRAPGGGRNQRRRIEADALVNRATSGLYPPGSTFKMVTVLAALEAGVIDLRERIDCGGSYFYGGRSFRCWNRSGHGLCDMHRAIRESCDVYHYEIARRVGIERLAAMARRLGLGIGYGAGIEPLGTGLIPTPAWKRGKLGRPWYGGETLIAGIGQGYVLATPLQMAVMTARLASGLAIEPTVIAAASGAPPRRFDRLGLSDRHLHAVRRAMWAAVNEGGGTGSRAALSGGGVEVAGKTGTSQVTRRSFGRSSSSLRWSLRDHALFVGYAPASAPRYAVAAIVEHGGGGGSTAAPLVSDILSEVLARDPLARPVFDPTKPSGSSPPQSAAAARQRG